MSLNERIREILEKSGLTSSEFADEIDVQRSSISHITSGRNKPSLEFVTKIKSKFPAISWDWLINGEGEMKAVSVQNEIAEKETILAEKKIVAPPDLFSLIDDEDFGKSESENKTQNETSRESFKPITHSANDQIIDSQRSEKTLSKILSENIDNQEVKLKRIVMFYSNGKFESFEQ
jgi:transcriptional regulator with XRE-family HTH domain